MNNNEEGFSLVEVIIVILIVGLIATVGLLVWDKQKSKKTDGTPTNTTSQQEVKESKSEKVTKADPNVGYLVMKEWGLRFKSPTGITDVKYAIHDDMAAFFAKPTGSSVTYRSDYDKFEEGNFHSTGILLRSNDSTKNKADTAVQGKKIGDHYYYTYWSFSGLATGAACVALYGDSSESNCKAESTVFQLINQGDSALLNTIELAK